MTTEKATKALPLYEGKNFSIGSKEIELDRRIPLEQYLSGVCFGRHINLEGNDSTITPVSNTRKMKFNPPSFKVPREAVTLKHTTDSVKPEAFSSNAQHNSMPSHPSLPEISNQPSSSWWTVNW